MWNINLLHAVTIYKGQRGFETRLSQNLYWNLTSHVPKLSQNSHQMIWYLITVHTLQEMVRNGHKKCVLFLSQNLELID